MDDTFPYFDPVADGWERDDAALLEQIALAVIDCLTLDECQDLAAVLP